MAGKNRRIIFKDRKPSNTSSSSSKGERSSFSVMSMFKLPATMKKSRDDGPQQEPMHPRRVYPSDEDRGRYVGEPDIDRKAAFFIAKFHEARVTEPERQALHLSDPERARVMDHERQTNAQFGGL